MPPRPAAAVEQPSAAADLNPVPNEQALGQNAHGVGQPLNASTSHLSDIQEASRSTTPTPVNPRPGQTRRPVNQRRPSHQNEAQSLPGSTNASSGDRPAKSTTEKERDREKRRLLNNALEQAHHAVDLDKNKLYDQAIDVYQGSCQILRVLLNDAKSDHDKEKLSAILSTYTTRVDELLKANKQAAAERQDTSAHARQVSITPSLDEALDQEIALQQPARARRTNHSNRQRADSRPQVVEPSTAKEVQVARSMPRQSAIPAPLAAKRQKRADRQDAQSASDEVNHVTDNNIRPESGVMNAHNDLRSEPKSSWLITGEEMRSSASTPSSPAHSNFSDEVSDTERKPASIIPTFGDSTSGEAQLDAAYDDAFAAANNASYYSAIDEAWDDGFDMDEMSGRKTKDPVADGLRSYAERESTIQRMSQRSHPALMEDLLSDEEAELDSDEEDRLLAEESTQDNGSSLTTVRPADKKYPRQSDSSASTSSRSAHTWGSSAGSSLNMTSSSLGTVDENVSLPNADIQKNLQKHTLGGVGALAISKSRDLSPHQEMPLAESDERSRSRSPNLRERRLSMPKARQLRIETGTESTSPERANRFGARVSSLKPVHIDISNPESTHRPDKPEKADTMGPQQSKQVPRLDPGQMNSPYPSPSAHNFSADVLTPPTPSAHAFSPHSSNEQSPHQTSPEKTAGKPERMPLKHNLSSMSLNKQITRGGRNLDETDQSPGTPASLSFPKDSQPPLNRAESALSLPLKTPIDGSSSAYPPTAGQNSMKIFDNEIHSAKLFGTPSSDASRDPKPLEPCPENPLFRVWYGMRLILNTLTHQKGGYMSDRWFVSRGVWKVANAKLKAVEEKTSNLDLLTAALLKLSYVDTFDADAVLDEMQSLEVVMEQARINLVKKLGNDIGPASMEAFIKDAPEPSSSDSHGPPDTKGNTSSTGSRSSSRSYLSWKKLRSKSSSTNLSSAGTRKGQTDEYTMATLPMTTQMGPNRKRRNQAGTRSRQVESIDIDGPNANYAAAIARLCDAAQILGKSRKPSHSY